MSYNDLITAHETGNANTGLFAFDLVDDIDHSLILSDQRGMRELKASQNLNTNGICIYCNSRSAYCLLTQGSGFKCKADHARCQSSLGSATTCKVGKGLYRP